MAICLNSMWKFPTGPGNMALLHVAGPSVFKTFKAFAHFNPKPRVKSYFFVKGRLAFEVSDTVRMLC